MTKAELIDQLHAEQTGQIHNRLGCRDTQLCLAMLLESITNALAQGERIEVRGFGSFNLHYRKARIGRNPNTGRPVHVPDKCILKFKPGRDLRQRVDNMS